MIHAYKFMLYNNIVFFTYNIFANTKIMVCLYWPWGYLFRLCSPVWPFGRRLCSASVRFSGLSDRCPASPTLCTQCWKSLRLALFRTRPFCTVADGRRHQQSWRFQLLLLLFMIIIIALLTYCHMIIMKILINNN